jgi:hypothetical protein
MSIKEDEMGRPRKYPLPTEEPTGPPKPTQLPAPERGVAESRAVKLKSGGTLTLSASTKFMALDATDRAFVFELIDKLADYESKQTEPLKVGG